MATTVAAGMQARVATAHQSGGTIAGSGPTSTFLSRGVWRINCPRKQLVRRGTRCEASGKGFNGLADEARRSAGEAARAIGRKADQVFDDVQDKAQRAAQTANSKVEEMTQRLGIEEPLSQYMTKKGKEIRSEMVGTAESVYSNVVAISSRPVVKRSIIGFLLFYAFSVVWAARILLFDKKSEEARERFGRELRLQKLREGGVSAPIARAPLDFTEIKVNGRNVQSANDKEFLDKLRKIQGMARAVRVAEQEVFSPSESAFVSISGKGPIPESEKKKSSVPTNRKDLLKKKKGRKEIPLEIQDGPVGLENKVSAKVEKPIDGNEHAKLVHEPEPSVTADPLRPVVEIPSAIEAEATKNVYTSETLQSQVSKIEALDSIAARSSDTQLPLKGDVVPSLNGNSKPHRSPLNVSAKDGKPTPSTLGNVTPTFNGAARSAPPMRSQPQKFKSMRVITSPEEARARIAARKAKDGSSSAKTTSTRPTFPRINVPAVESVASELGTDSEDSQPIDQAGFMEKDKGSVSAEDSESFKGNKAGSKSSSSREKKQEPTSVDQEEEEAWMRDEVLRNIVLKVRDNEEAGLESFHGLDSEAEQKFFKGLERKYEREGEAVKNWIQDRVENLDYGVGGVGVDDPPESFVARWKDQDDPERAKRFAKFQEDRKRILEKQMGISQTTDDTSSASTSPSPASKSSQTTDRPSSASTSSSPSPASKSSQTDRPSSASTSSSPSPVLKPSQTTGGPSSASTSSSPSPALKPSQTTGGPSSASISSSNPALKRSQTTGRPSSASTASPSPPRPASAKDITKKDAAKERLQSNGNASVSKTIVTSTGKQAKPVPREWQHTKKWAQELQQKYDLETDTEKRSLMEEVGQDLDRWITEDEIEEASRLLSQGLPGEQEYVRMHYEKTREKISKQHEMFGSGGMLNKYGEYKETKKEPELWWLDLPYVLCIGLTTSSDGGNSSAGFYSLDMTPDFAGMEEGPTSTYNHTVAFQDQKDALNFCGLLLSEQYSADVIPLAPKDLYQDAKQEGFKVTVIKKGQLGLVPGQALDDVEQRLIEIGSSIYWEELERARSIDIDAVLDEGFGYGRPSR